MFRRFCVPLFLLVQFSPSLHAQAPVPYGTGTPGTQGRVPVLAVDSDLCSGNADFGCNVTEALSGAGGFLVCSFGRANLPTPVIHVNVDPALSILILGFQVDASGRGFAGFSVPALPPEVIGLHVYFQAAVQDPGAAGGWAGSRGLDATLLASPREGTSVPRGILLWFRDLTAMNSPATQSFLSRWRAQGLTVEFSGSCQPFLHVSVPQGGLAVTFLADAQAALGGNLDIIERATWSTAFESSQGTAAYPDDPQWPAQWNIQAVEGPLYLGPYVPRVGVLDSGIFKLHHDLVNVVDDEGGAGAPPVGVGPAQNHGTHVAGVMAAHVDNAVAITGLVDIRPGEAQTPWVTSLRVARDSTGVFDDGKIVSMIVRSADCAPAGRMNLLNLSFGRNDRLESQARAVAAAAAQGVLMVAASGNRTLANPSLLTRYPARLSEVVSVGSVGSTFTRSTFSCFGPEFGDVDLVAPGEGIWTTQGSSNFTESTEGTSVAAPHVTGAAAAIWSFVRTPAAPLLKADVVKRLLRVYATRPITGNVVELGNGVLDLSGELILSKAQSDPDYLYKGAHLMSWPVRAASTLRSLDPSAGSLEITPDRESFVYTRHLSRTNFDLFVANRTGFPGTPGSNLTNTPDRKEDGAVVSPDGTKVYYTVWHNTARQGWIEERGIDGSNPRVVANVYPGFEDLHISPDGTTLVFGHFDYIFGQGGVYIYDLSSANLQLLVRGDFSTRYYHPRFSPDGRKIAAHRRTGSAPNYRMEVVLFDSATGGNLRVISGDGVFACPDPPQGSPYWNGAANWCPTWSPNGRYLYYLHSVNPGTGDLIRCYDFRNDRVVRSVAAPHTTSGTPLLEPLPISDCHPRLVTSRW